VPQGLLLNDAARTIIDRPSMKLSVVAPCFNEENNIPGLLERVRNVCQEAVGKDFEIVLVNDGSRDATWAEIESAARSGSNIAGVNLARNYGHQLALTAGLSVARGERILVIDADLQDPPELLGEMMSLMDGGADVVYGQRLERPGDSSIRRAASSIFYRLLRRLSDVDIPIDTGDFRLISRRVLNVLLEMPEHHRFIRGMISWVGFRQVPIHYRRDERTQGVTGYSLKRLVAFAIDAITGFSIRPLRVATFAGIGVASIAMIYAGYIFLKWLLFGLAVSGWTSLMLVILLVSGIQMLFLGLIGEYVGRVFQEAKGRPLYVIAELAVSDDPGLDG
jgi:glycosyltransferase involved in cell wall biosynthesis